MRHNLYFSVGIIEDLKQSFLSRNRRAVSIPDTMTTQKEERMSKGKQKSYRQSADTAEMKPATHFITENPIGKETAAVQIRDDGDLTLKSFISIADKKIRYFI